MSLDNNDRGESLYIKFIVCFMTFPRGNRTQSVYTYELLLFIDFIREFV